jgi:hypothetical protein
MVPWHPQDRLALEPCLDIRFMLIIPQLLVFYLHGTKSTSLIREEVSRDDHYVTIIGDSDGKVTVKV